MNFQFPAIIAPLNHLRRSAALLGLISLSSLASSPLLAQDKPAEPTTPPAAPAPVQPPTSGQPAAVTPIVPQPSSINFKQRPTYPTDLQRLRRTPTVDGVLGDGEWDPFYTITDGAIKGTIYCNWDDNYLYIAARSDQASTLLVDVDAGGDGWLRGADNLEVVVSGVGDTGGLGVLTRLLDASNSKEAPVWNEKATDAKSILAAGKIVNGTQVVELAIPKNTASLMLRNGVTFGLRVEFLPPMPATAYVPTAPFEPHLLLDAKLVETRAQSMAGINPTLTLSDYKCVAGQKLFARLDLLNQTDARIPVKSILWSGSGNSTNVVNMLREVNVNPIPPMKTLRRSYNTLLPEDVAPGSYALTSTAEFEGGKQVQSTVTFTVVEPISVTLGSEPQPIAVVGQTKLGVLVDVFSAVPRGTKVSIELTTVPAGWEVDGNKKRTLEIDREDGRRVLRYGLKLPSTTAPGDYPVEAVVTWKKREWKLRHIVQVVRTDTPKPADSPKPEPGKSDPATTK